MADAQTAREAALAEREKAQEREVEARKSEAEAQEREAQQTKRVARRTLAELVAAVALAFLAGSFATLSLPQGIWSPRPLGASRQPAQTDRNDHNSERSCERIKRQENSSKS